MGDDRWLQVAARLGARDPVDLDAVLFDAGSEAPSSGWLTRQGIGRRVVPSARLWPLNEDDGAFVGVRVSSPIGDVIATATRLVAIACERAITPIILSQLPVCGLERFGFRVERLPDGDPAQLRAFEEELMRFWRIAVVIDASQIADFG